MSVGQWLTTKEEEEASQYTLYSRPSGNTPAMETNCLTFLRTSSTPVSGENSSPFDCSSSFRLEKAPMVQIVTLLSGCVHKIDRYTLTALGASDDFAIRWGYF